MADYDEVGSKGKGGSKKGIIIALLVIASIATAAFIMGTSQNAFSKLPSKTSSATGFFGLLAGSEPGTEDFAASAQDENSNVSQFKNIQLKAEFSAKDLNFVSDRNSEIVSEGTASIEIPGQTVKLSGSSKILGFTGSINSSLEGIIAVGNVSGIENSCNSSSFEKSQPATISAESLAINDASSETIQAVLQGSIEISTPNGKTTITLAKDSKAVLKNFKGSIQFQKGKTVLEGSAEEMLIIGEK
ncbi:MAG: hypothetical protein Q7R70_01675 [Candidatus Diapherotrites archaeon]|nr:hypothetical protein [Candidatus Diapherotrites archaeon]